MKLNKLKLGAILALTVIIGIQIPIKSNALEVVNQYDTILTESNTEKNIQVEISEKVRDKVSQEEIDDLINEADDGDVILIHDVIYSEEDNEIDNNMIRPMIDSFRYTKTTKSNVKTNQNLGSKFVCSVAKGQTKTINATYKMSATVKGTYDNFLEITGKRSVSYTVEDKFTGPKGSKNSREYRIKFIGDKGNYTQKLYEIIGPKQSVIRTHKGTYTTPKKGLMYSIDRTIK
ncbi:MULTISPECIES: hypothetical protein [Terrisporobacter]|uniref:Uncharacterized protein n=1 Tax=Terrisporobacter othiniensis TaxID=1577792 RepID=A0A0B3VZL5_9FIRM|nr:MULTISPECIES: hypothetical protein [Terrisporobacter]KHS58244.1 hypothetical protein QX51_03980 [Terrisporobacter othiniensis]MCC3671567.1 hypothetical protein [Terrisporobacter mayombei]